MGGQGQEEEVAGEKRQQQEMEMWQAPGEGHMGAQQEEGKRWWEDAMGGQIEERRLEGLKYVEGLRKGMDGMKELSVPLPN